MVIDSCAYTNGHRRRHAGGTRGPRAPVTHAVGYCDQQHREARLQQHAHGARPDELHADDPPQALAHRVPKDEGVVEDGPRAHNGDGGPQNDAVVRSRLDPLREKNNIKQSSDERIQREGNYMLREPIVT